MRKIEKLIIGLLILCAVMGILAFITSLMVYQKPTTINNYKIENATMVLPQEAIESETPFITDNEKTMYGEPPISEKYDLYEETFYKTAYQVGEDFRPINCKINNWVIKEDYQKILYNACKKYNVNFIQALAIMYKESAYNDPYATSGTNYNGTCDMGLMQINSFNTDVIKKVAKTEDVDVLYNPVININCGCYIIWRNEKYNEYCSESMFDSIMAYNGGTGTLKKFKTGEYTTKCNAYQYAVDVVNIMEQLDNWYREEYL